MAGVTTTTISGLASYTTLTGSELVPIDVPNGVGGYTTEQVTTGRIAAQNALTPEQFGAVGNGIADDTQALTAMFAAWFAAGYLDSNNTFNLGTCILNRIYRITSKLTIQAPNYNVLGGLLVVNGVIQLSTPGVGLQFLNGPDVGHTWTGLTIQNGTFIDCGLQFTALSQVYALFGVRLYGIRVQPHTQTTNQQDIPAHGVNFDGAYESLMSDARIIWASTTHDAVANTVSAGSAYCSSNVFSNCTIRGGRYCLSQFGYSLDLYVENGTIQWAYSYGIYAEVLNAVIRDVHLEDNCLAEVDDASVYVIGGCQISGVISQGYAANDSSAKYGVKLYGTRAASISGCYHNSDISGTAIASVESDGYNPVYLAALPTYVYGSVVAPTLWVNGEGPTAPFTAAHAITVAEAGKTFTNEGTTARVDFTLPAAQAGDGPYTFYTQDSDGVRVIAGTGDTIRVATSVSSSGGQINNATVGSSIQLRAINATEWVATQTVGTWTAS